jgi:multisubunit Na+/H+ antiporter MnhB subunit
MLSLVFDGLLALALLWSAWRTLATPDLPRAVVMFIVFGLLMSLAWARLSAPDIALAEAAIGAGLTGALLLDALGTWQRQTMARQAISGAVRFAVVLLALALAGILVAAILGLPAADRELPNAVSANLSASGVAHPVTAVLLNFRGYDTLLEVAVLLLALVAMLALLPREVPATAPAPVDAVLQALARLVVPLMILAAGYLLWAGAHRPGGAFQAGAVLAGAAVLLYLAGLLPAWASPGFLLRVGLAGGFVVFLALAIGLVPEGALLRYPAEHAGSLILLIEASLTLSLGLILAGLFLVLAAHPAVGRGRAGGEDQS